jgi:tetratricopeptide (TPR) repeat protein
MADTVAAPPPRRGVAGERAQTACLASAFLAIEATLLYLATLGSQPLLAAAMHLGLVAGTGFWLFRRGRAPVSRSLALLWTTSAFLGPFAAAGVLLQLALTAALERSALPAGEWYARLFPDAGDDEAVRRFEALRRAGEAAGPSDAPVSFLDMAATGTPGQKRVLLQRVGRRFRPAFAPALKLGLQDPNSAIRVQAAATIAQVESRFLRQALDLARAVRARPEDAEAKLQLARLYDEYADSGLLDEHRQAENRQRALALYHDCLRRGARESGLVLAVGRLLFRAGKSDEAARWLEENAVADSPDAGTLFTYLECLFKLGRFDELRRLVQRHYGVLTLPDALPAAARRALDLWQWAGRFPLAGRTSP